MVNVDGNVYHYINATMKKNITLKGIAEKTGFSIKTVSRAINNHPDVNAKTREKILSVAREYAYSPNLVAKSLRTQKAFTIGYIVPDIANEFFGKVGIVIEKEFRKYGYSLLISFTEESEENEINSLKLLLAKRVDGIVLATVGTTGKFLEEVIYRQHVPVVVIDNRDVGIKTNLVLHDNVIRFEIVIDIDTDLLCGQIDNMPAGCLYNIIRT